MKLPRRSRFAVLGVPGFLRMCVLGAGSLCPGLCSPAPAGRSWGPSDLRPEHTPSAGFSQRSVGGRAPPGLGKFHSICEARGPGNLRRPRLLLTRREDAVRRPPLVCTDLTPRGLSPNDPRSPDQCSLHQQPGILVPALTIILFFTFLR